MESRTTSRQEIISGKYYLKKGNKVKSWTERKEFTVKSRIKRKEFNDVILIIRKE